MGVTWLAERYELGDVLGRGGMADVHAATDHLLSRQVAVKVLRDTTETAEDRARFELEARTLARLSHRHLVTVLDAGLEGARPFLVMELVPGPSLADALADGPMDLERVLALGRGVAEALAYAHDAGVVHRDVKPGNVLLGTAGSTVKLADFGIARLLGDTVRHTRTGHAIGTAAYFAPEQVTGQLVTGAADVYSLGLVLIESLTGERCYPGPATEAALARLSQPAVVPAGLSPFLADLLRQMTALEPTARPDAAEVAQRLARTPLRPPPDSRPPPPRLPDRTQLRMPAAALVAAPTTPPGGGGPTWQDRLRGVPTDRWAIAAVAALMVLLLVVAALAS